MVRWPLHLHSPTVLIGLLMLLSLSLNLQAESPAKPDWRLDVLRLRNGSTLNGMIEEETATSVRFQFVQRKSGRPTVSFHTTIPHSDILAVERITPIQRAELRAQLHAISNAGQEEQIRTGMLELTRADWHGQPNAALRYDSDYFVLVSDAPEALVRRAAVKLEQIYAAYSRFLQPRHTGGRPTTIWLFRSAEGYRNILRKQGQSFLNPACFDPDANRILCVSELDRMGDDLESIRKRHLELGAELNRQAAELTQLYPNPKERERFLSPIRETRRRIDQQNRKNEAIIDRATARLFAVLYHEAFHAYAANFVYPERGPNSVGALPRWLNEGLAQIFETGIIELGELRLGHADKDRLTRVRELVRKQDLMPLRELLRAGPNSFNVLHADERANSDRVYLTSWALAFYLTFDRRLLGTSALDCFVAAHRDGSDVLMAFEKLLGKPIDQIESDFQRYLSRLQEDGTIRDLGTMRR